MLSEDDAETETEARPVKENELRPPDKMFIELLVLLALVAAICYVAYRSAIHEFQILQKDYDPDTDWGALLSEQLPLVIRDVPPSWLGGWTYGKTGHKTWPVYVSQKQGKDKDIKRRKVAWNAYLAEQQKQQKQKQSVDCEELAASVKLLQTFQNWGYDGMSRAWWLPVETPTPHLFVQDDHTGLEKTKAEWTVIASTDGAPLELWVAHEGAVPPDVYDYEEPVNPWTATTEHYPWVGDVKFIEIKLRPGNVLMLPRHWWFAVRSADNEGGGDEGPSLNAHGAWWWRGDFHSVTSRVVSLVPE